MIRTNDTVFKYYLAMMDSFEEFLANKYPKSNSIEDTKHYQTIIIGKIVQMFHSLELLTKDSLDEVSARCVLRGILDSVTTYCFIYQRTDEEDVLFRHFLYILDGWREYKKSVIRITGETEDKEKTIELCNNVTNQLEEKLRQHSYYIQDSSKVETLIRENNWKYKSFPDTTKLGFREMYKTIKIEANTSEYYQGFLSQFVHGLCLSNILIMDSERMKRVLYESIPIAARFIQVICQTFHNKDLMTHFLTSDNIHLFVNSEDFNYDDLTDFVQALVRKDNTILI